MAGNEADEGGAGEAGTTVGALDYRGQFARWWWSREGEVDLRALCHRAGQADLASSFADSFWKETE